MRVEIELAKNAWENANAHYKASKKAKEKIIGALKALEESRKKLQQAEKKEEKREAKIPEKKKWYEKFRWFFLDDFLVIGGKDADTNEALIKKHTEKEDIVFHADLTGAPFTVIKTEGKEVSEEILKCAAALAACYSKAWAGGLGAVDVYWIKPEQVSKSAPAGEYIGKGAFMIYGKKNYYKNTRLDLAVGYKDRLVVGDEEFVRKRCGKIVIIQPGFERAKEIAVKIKKKLKADADTEEIQRIVPAGKGRVK